MGAQYPRASFCAIELLLGVWFNSWGVQIPQLFRIALTNQYGLQFAPKVLNGDYLWILDNWLGGSTEWVLRDECYGTVRAV